MENTMNATIENATTEQYGYKVFKPDFTCKGVEYKVGETMEFDGELVVGRSGLHFRKSALGTFTHYRFNPLNKVALVKAEGTVEGTGDMCCTDKLYIEKELSWAEVLELATKEAISEEAKKKEEEEAEDSDTNTDSEE